MSKFDVGVRAFSHYTIYAASEQDAEREAKRLARDDIPSQWTIEGTDPVAVDGGEVWGFDVGDIVEEEHPVTMEQGGVEVYDSGEIQYRIKRRLLNVDDDERFYFVEWEDVDNLHTMLKSASMLENSHHKVGEVDE